MNRRYASQLPGNLRVLNKRIQTTPELVSTFKTPWVEADSQLALFRFIAETRQLVAISRGGDVITIAGEDGDFAVGASLVEGKRYLTYTQVDVVGSFESGILAAAWNPDESCVAILTGRLTPCVLLQIDQSSGERKLLLLSSAFDVLSEKPIETAEFGEGMECVVRIRLLTFLRCAYQRWVGIQADTIPRLAWKDGSTGSTSVKSGHQS